MRCGYVLCSLIEIQIDSSGYLRLNSSYSDMYYCVNFLFEFHRVHSKRCILLSYCIEVNRIRSKHCTFNTARVDKFILFLDFSIRLVCYKIV